MISTKLKNKQAVITQTHTHTEKKNVFEAKGFNLWYGDDHALKNIEFDI